MPEFLQACKNEQSNRSHFPFDHNSGANHYCDLKQLLEVNVGSREKLEGQKSINNYLNKCCQALLNYHLSLFFPVAFYFTGFGWLRQSNYLKYSSSENHSAIN